MDKKTVFVKTARGESETNGQSDALFGDNKRILILVDDESTVGEITKRAPPSLRDSVNEVLQELVDGGFIKDMREPARAAEKPALKMSTPAFRMATPKAEMQTPPPPPEALISSGPSATAAESMDSEQKSDLDFSFIMSPSGQPAPRSQANDAWAHAQAEAIAEQGAARLKAEQAAQKEAAEKAAKMKAYEEAKVKAQIEVAARARIEAEARAKKEAEAARLKAEQEALRARNESAAAKARIEAEVRARLEAEARIKQEAEAIRRKAEQEAEKLRKELEAARIKAETELKIRLEAEARAKAELEARIKREAEAERLRLEKAQAELEVARVKAMAEIKMREEAELRVRAEIEARLKADALAKLAAESKLNQNASGAASGKTSVRREGKDSAEIVRQSFVESFSQNKRKSDISTGSFKLEKFSLVDTGKISAFTGEAPKPELLPGAGSKVKAVLAERARKEEEARRLQAEKEASSLNKVQDEASRIRQQQEEAAARVRAEQEAVRLKAEHEAYRLQVQQEAERAEAEAEAQKLTAQQSQQWEDARRRAVAQAQAEQERAAKQAADALAKSRQKPARGARKPLPLGKIVAGLLALAIVAVAALPYVWPTGEYIAPIETEISAQIKQPVHIKYINFAFLPVPRLELHSVAVGKAEELKIGTVVMNFDISALLASTRSISKLELNAATLSGPALEQIAGWLQMAGGVEKYPVARMEFTGLQIKGDKITLPALNGHADFDPQGKFTKAVMKSGDGKLGLEMQLQQNSLMIEANLLDGSLPIFSSLKFNDLSFHALASIGDVVFSDFFAHIHGGTLTGKGRLNWGNGWKLQGQINARNMDLRRMFPGSVISGELLGDINISMAGAELSQLDKNPVVEGSFEAKNGNMEKIDLETIARFGVRPGVAGHTNFTELAGTVKSGNHQHRIFISKLLSSAATTTGLIEVDENQQLSGKLETVLRGPGNANLPLKLSGTVADPVLQQGR